MAGARQWPNAGARRARHVVSGGRALWSTHHDRLLPPQPRVLLWTSAAIPPRRFLPAMPASTAGTLAGTAGDGHPAPSRVRLGLPAGIWRRSRHRPGSSDALSPRSERAGHCLPLTRSTGRPNQRDPRAPRGPRHTPAPSTTRRMVSTGSRHAGTCGSALLLSIHELAHAGM